MMRQPSSLECMNAMDAMHGILKGDERVLEPNHVQTVLAKLEHDGDVIQRRDLLNYLKAFALSHERLRVTRMTEHI
jgi:hypothetical protein